jgi:hypothetical protein
VLTIWLVLQAAPVSAVGRTRQLIVATVGLIAIVALPVFAVYWARKKWRP